MDLRYAKKLSEGPASGRSYNGKIIDSDDYTEEIYEANQFHGQDGLGRAIFGYTDNQQSRLEARNANGEVRGKIISFLFQTQLFPIIEKQKCNYVYHSGQYQYIDPFGSDIQVQYWVDSLGFHQTDNHPRYNLQPVTETPEVKQAREEHARLWKEAARLNGVDDSNDLYNTNADKLDDENYDDDQELEGQVSNQHQSLARYPVLPYTNHIAPENAKSFGKVIGDSVVVESINDNNLRSRFARQQQNEIEEVTSEPRGFFYSFDYPVPFIVDRNAKSKQLPEAQADEEIYEASNLVDVRFNHKRNSENFDAEPQASQVSQQSLGKIVPEDEIHTVETSPKQQSVSESKIVKSLKTPQKEFIAAPKLTRGRGSVKYNAKSS